MGAERWLERLRATRCPVGHAADGQPCDSIPDTDEELFCASRIQAAERAEQYGATLWWVHYGNYFPREVDSTWPTRAEAEKRRDELNAAGNTSMWECEEAG